MKMRAYKQNGFIITNIDDNAAADFKVILEAYPAAAFFSFDVISVPNSTWGEKYVLATYEGHALDKKVAKNVLRSNYKHAKEIAFHNLESNYRSARNQLKHG